MVENLGLLTHDLLVFLVIAMGKVLLRKSIRAPGLCRQFLNSWRFYKVDRGKGNVCATKGARAISQVYAGSYCRDGWIVNKTGWKQEIRIPGINTIFGILSQ
jgi:hypothetical protein